MEKGAKKADNKKRMRRTALKRPGGESSVKINAQEGEKKTGRPTRDNKKLKGPVGKGLEQLMNATTERSGFDYELHEATAFRTVLEFFYGRGVQRNDCDIVVNKFENKLRATVSVHVITYTLQTSLVWNCGHS